MSLIREMNFKFKNASNVPIDDREYHTLVLEIRKLLIDKGLRVRVTTDMDDSNKD